jgi:hypothetical protein
MGKTPFFYLPSLPIQTGEGWAASAGGAPGVGGGRGGGENRGGIEGISPLCSPWAGIACGGGSAASGGNRLWW